MKLLSMLLLFVVGATTAFAAGSEIKVGKKEKIGSYLADARGMTLYYFTKDNPGKSACAGDCVTKWPLYLNEAPVLPQGLKASDFGVITREDGKKQSTFKGMPLYYYFKDKTPADTLGQGVNRNWYVVDPATFRPR